jgi:quercetin dioxygenase-like cupin family protein
VRTITKICISIGVAALGIGVVWATPIVGMTFPFLAVGTHQGEQRAQGSGIATNGERFHVRLEADGPAASAIQDAAIEPGGSNGWHSHPGMVVVMLVAGSITWYDENCNPTEYKAGDAWIEGEQLHAFKVTSSQPIHIMAYFLTAKGLPVRTDQPAPECAKNMEPL